MEKNYKINKDIKKTKSGIELGKVLHIEPLKGKKIRLKDLNTKIYKSLLTKFDVLDINIRAKTPDGMKTLKSFDTADEDLIHTLDDYYNDLPKEKRNKFKKLEDIYIYIRTI